MKRKKVVVYLLTAFLLLPLSLTGCKKEASQEQASATSAESSSDATQKPKVAVLLTQKRNEGNWDITGWQAFQEMGEKYNFEYSAAEQAAYDLAPEILRDYGSRGYDLIIGHSSGYESAFLEVAPEFPDTKFVVFSDLSTTNNIPNLSGWAVYYPEFGFQTGVLAGLMTKSNKIGEVAGLTIPAFTRSTAGFREGIKYVNPDAELQVLWINTLTDAAKAKEAALTLIDWGADILTHHCDTAALGLFEAAKAERVLTIGNYADEYSTAPDVIITSGLVDIMKGYDEIGQYFVEGKLKSEIKRMSISNGMIKMAEFHNVPAEIQGKVNEIIEGIKSGKIQVPDVDERPGS